jgi:penicillin-binding protein 2
VKSIEDETSIKPKYLDRHKLPMSRENFDMIVEGMSRVVTKGAGGTASWVEIPNIPMCGKTGTAQNPHGKDHSIFMGFAPRDNPKIAIAVYIENAGFGASWAAPIASLLIEKYITDSIKRPWVEKYVLNGNFLLNGADD